MQAQINNLNITEEFKKEYACKIKYNFRDNALAMFVESCRNVFVHEGIPFAKIVFTGQKIELLVDVKELQKSPYFENKGNPGCFDMPDKTFIDLYMKSGLCFSSIVISTDALAYIILGHEEKNTMTFLSD